MLTKKNKIPFLAALLLIIPFMLNAAGNQEAGAGNGITLDERVMVLISNVESGDMSVEEAVEEFKELEKEYSVTAEERNQIQNMMKNVGSGEKTAEECEESLMEQLQTREKIQDKIQDRTSVQNQNKSVSSEDKGDSASSGSGKK